MNKRYSRKKGGQKELNIKKIIRRSPQYVISRLVLAMLLLAVISGMYISLASRSAEWVAYTFPNLAEGEISPRREIAPFDFVVPKSERQLELERRAAEDKILPIFKLDTAVMDTVSARIDTLFAVIDYLRKEDVPDSVSQLTVDASLPDIPHSQVNSLKNLVEAKNSRRFERSIQTAMKEAFGNISDLLIVASDTDVTEYTDELFMLDNGDTVRVEMTIESEAALDFLGKAFQSEIGGVLSPEETETVRLCMNNLLQPNLTYDNVATSELRAQAREAVPIHSASFKKNERIIDANVPITQKQLEILDALRDEVARRSFIENRWRHYAIAIGKTLITAGIVCFISIFLFLYRRKIFDSLSKLVLLVVVSSIPIAIAFFAVRTGDLSEYLIPVAISSIIITILFDAELGILCTLGITFTVSSFFPGAGLRIGLIYFLSGSLGGGRTVGRERHRKEFYKSMVIIPIVTAVAIAATNDWITHPSLTDTGYDMLLGALNGFFSPIIAIGLLPLLESLFKVSTDITLLELSDLNNPLLKELAVRAPGTYSGVLVVGTLAEAAAEKTGANPLLCRVGAYYHDIGKINIPEYFIENQMGGENPHDRLTPHMSSLILASHVKEGYEMGSKHGLPEAVLDIILQHHGTSLMQSFYHKAVEEAGEKAVDENAFRYPGPKPQTREAGIVMLADLAEAASRSIQEKSPGRLKSLINTIFQKRFLDGELDECELTLKDLHNIEESFLPILVGSHHGRIEYPWQKGENGQNNTAPENRTPSGTFKEISDSGIH